MRALVMPSMFPRAPEPDPPRPDGPQERGDGAPEPLADAPPMNAVEGTASAQQGATASRWMSKPELGAATDSTEPVATEPPPAIASGPPEILPALEKLRKAVQAPPAEAPRAVGPVPAQPPLPRPSFAKSGRVARPAGAAPAAGGASARPTSHRSTVARAGVWTLAAFLLRRLGELALLMVLALHVAREDLGLFNAWKTVMLPLGIAVAGGWDVSLLRRRMHAGPLVQLMVFGSLVAVGVVGFLLMVFAGGLAAWYRQPGMALWFQLGGLWLLSMAATRAVRAVLARQLDLATVARFEVLRLSLYGIGVLWVVWWVPGSALQPSFVRVQWLIGAFIAADALEALGLMFISRGGALFREAWARAAHSPLAWPRLLAAWRREWRFAATVTLDGLLYALSAGVPIYLIGRQLGAVEIAWFAIGLQFVQIPLATLLDAANRVLLPGLRSVAPANLADRTLEAVRMLALVCLPVLLWAFAVAPEFFGRVFGEHWRPAGDLTRLLVLYLLLAPMTNVSGAIEALKNRPDVGLWWNLTTLLGRVLVLWWGLRWGGLYAGVLAYAMFSLAMWAAYQWLLARLLGVSLRDYVMNYARFALLWAALLAFYVVWPTGGVDDMRVESLAIMVMGGAAGLILYAAALAVFYRNSARQIWLLIKALRPVASAPSSSSPHSTSTGVTPA